MTNCGRPGANIPPLCALALCFLLSPAAACQSGDRPLSSIRSSGLDVEAVLKDGEEMRGSFEEETVTLRGLAIDGTPVSVAVERPPSWSSSTLGCDIDWIEDRQVFVVRTLNWTGELKVLDLKLALLRDSRYQVLDASEASHLQLRYPKH